jgi:hypothetical protein
LLLNRVYALGDIPDVDRCAPEPWPRTAAPHKRIFAHTSETTPSRTSSASAGACRNASTRHGTTRSASTSTRCFGPAPSIGCDWNSKEQGGNGLMAAHTNGNTSPRSASTPLPARAERWQTLADRRGDPAAGSDSSPLRELLADRDREAPWDQALRRAAARRLAGDGAVKDRAASRFLERLPRPPARNRSASSADAATRDGDVAARIEKIRSICYVLR